MGQDVSAGEGALLLMHIPKTAGTSVRWVVEQQYPAGALQYLYPGHGPQIEALVAAARVRKPAVVMGHFRFGLHDRLPGGGRYVTFFRDPVDQAISLFNYLQTVDDPDNRGVLRPGAGIDEFLRHGWARNLQTQFVTGLTPEEIDDDPVGAYRLAEVILDRHFLAVGLVERLASSLRTLAGLLSWRVQKIPRLNRAADRGCRMTRSDLSAATVTRIAQVNACDFRLYALARRITTPAWAVPLRRS